MRRFLRTDVYSENVSGYGSVVFTIIDIAKVGGKLCLIE